MKRYILLAALCLFMAALMAEPGLFELSFGQNLEEAHAALLVKGFHETERGFMYVDYKNDKIPELSILAVYDHTNKGTISDWSVYYEVQDNPKLIEKILSDLTVIHKKEPDSTSVQNEWICKMNAPSGLRVSLSEDRAILKVEYSSDQDELEAMDWMGW